LHPHAMHFMHVKHRADKERERMHARKRELAEHVAAKDAAAKKADELRKAAVAVGRQQPKTLALLIASLWGKKRPPAQPEARQRKGQ